MNFVEYYGLCHSHHNRVPRFVPISKKAQISTEDSKSMNARLLGERFRQQLRNFPSKDQEKLLETLEINVRFGTFYLIDEGRRLQEMSRFKPYIT